MGPGRIRQLLLLGLLLFYVFRIGEVVFACENDECSQGPGVCECRQNSDACKADECSQVSYACECYSDSDVCKSDQCSQHSDVCEGDECSNHSDSDQESESSYFTSPDYEQNVTSPDHDRQSSPSSDVDEGQWVDAVYKSYPGTAGTEVALIKERYHEARTPKLSRDYHPDFHPAFEYSVFISENVSNLTSAVAIGPPISGQPRSKHLYYMASQAGDYIVTSALSFNEPETTLRFFITWVACEEHQEIFSLTYEIEKDCQIHHVGPNGLNFVTTLPDYDCPWASVVPSPSACVLALIYHPDVSLDPYKLRLKFIVATHDYLPIMLETDLEFYNAQVESHISYHWTKEETFRVYGGSSAFEVALDGSIQSIAYDRRARLLQRTNSGRVSHDGKACLTFDGYEQSQCQERENVHEKPFYNISQS